MSKQDMIEIEGTVVEALPGVNTRPHFAKLPGIIYILRMLIRLQTAACHIAPPPPPAAYSVTENKPSGSVCTVPYAHIKTDISAGFPKFLKRKPKNECKVCIHCFDDYFRSRHDMRAVHRHSLQRNRPHPWLYRKRVLFAWNFSIQWRKRFCT